MAEGKFQYLAGTLVPGTKYRVIRLLGAGGMGTVYEVEDTTIDKRYVLKTLHANLSSRKDLVERMQREAKALAKLEHRNIVQVITADVTGDSLKLPYFVMQKLHGHTLRTVLDHKGRLEIDAAVRLSIDLLNALYHAHENGIIHRDVKPENIFLHRDPDGLTVPKLLDFGVMATTEAVTMTGQRFIGTLRYAAPEQLLGEKVTPATDLYAAALVLYESLAGRGPFEEEGEAMKVARAHLEKVPPLVSQFREVPPSLERMVMRSLSKSAADRHPDAFTFAAELHRFLRELRGSLPPDKAEVTTASDVMKLPVPGALADAARGVVTPVKTPPSSGSAPTRPDAPVAGATLPASKALTAALRPVGAGDTPPDIGESATDIAPALAPSEPGARDAARGATIEAEPPPMTLGEEPVPFRVAVARDEAAREKALAPKVDRNAETGTRAPPLAPPARDGETELIDSMIGEGLARAGTPPARIVKRDVAPASGAPGREARDAGEAAPPSSRSRAADPASDGATRGRQNATSASGTTSHTVSEAPAARERGGRAFTLAMTAIVSLSLVAAAALIYASRRAPGPAANEHAPASAVTASTNAPPTSATASAIPTVSPIATEAVPSAAAPSATTAASSAVPAPAISSDATKTVTAPTRAERHRSSERPAPRASAPPVAAASPTLQAAPITPAPAPPPASAEPARRVLPRSGL